MPLPTIRAPVPAFTATALFPDKEFKSLSLSDYLGKWVVLFWYPLDFTFVCPTEIIAFGDRQADFDSINTQVIAASCDSKFTHLAWVNTPRADGGLGDMKIPIVADFSREIAQKYGVLVPNSDPDDAGVPFRALFIISPTGILRQITVNDLPVGRNVDEIIRLIQAFQHNDKYGEVCPANWTPGAKTMNADPIKSKEYFTTVNAISGVTSSANVATATSSSYSGPLVQPITEIDDLDDFNTAIAGSTSGLVVVDFWAPWCKNCKKIMPLIDKLSSELFDSGVRVIKVNTESGNGGSIAADNNVEAMPSLHFFKNGKKLGFFMGSDINAVEKSIRSYANV